MPTTPALLEPQIENVLTRLGLSFISTKTGKEAWDRLKALAQEARSANTPIRQKVAMVLTDLEMPEMDGFTLTRSHQGRRHAESDSGSDPLLAFRIGERIPRQQRRRRRVRRKIRSRGACAGSQQGSDENVIGNEVLALEFGDIAATVPLGRPLYWEHDATRQGRDIRE